MNANHVIAAGIFIATVTIAATTAFAIDGRNAVGKCIDRPGCMWGVNKDGSIDIVTPDGVVITCPSATGECRVLGRKKGTREETVGGAAGGTANP